MSLDEVSCDCKSKEVYVSAGHLSKMHSFGSKYVCVIFEQLDPYAIHSYSNMIMFSSTSVPFSFSSLSTETPNEYMTT